MDLTFTSDILGAFKTIIPEIAVRRECSHISQAYLGFFFFFSLMNRKQDCFRDPLGNIRMSFLLSSYQFLLVSISDFAHKDKTFPPFEKVAHCAETV